METRVSLNLGTVAGQALRDDMAMSDRASGRVWFGKFEGSLSLLLPPPTLGAGISRCGISRWYHGNLCIIIKILFSSCGDVLVMLGSTASGPGVCNYCPSFRHRCAHL